MKDFERQMAELEKQLEKMGDELSEYYAKYGEKIAEKCQEFGKKIERKFSEAAKDYESGSDGSKDASPQNDAEGESGEPAKGKNSIEKMLPYLDEEALHEITVDFINGETYVNMKKVLPYLEEDDVSLLVKKLCASDGEQFNGLTVDDVLPYAEEEDVDALFMKGVKSGRMYKQLIGYVSDDCWHELAEDYCKNENSALDIDEVLPYLDEDDIRLIFKTYLKRNKKNL